MYHRDLMLIIQIQIVCASSALKGQEFAQYLISEVKVLRGKLTETYKLKYLIEAL